MTRWLSGVCVIAVCVALAPSLGAQWPSYPTPGVPRTADGKPILDGPAPRMPDGKVDFSGIWEIRFGGGGGGGRGRGAGAPATPPPAPDPNAIPVSQFFEVAGRGYPLPLQPWAAELKKKRMADNSKDNPDVWCLPIGLMQYHNHPQPRQIVQTKNLMLITYESNYGLRYIYLDGRPAPTNDPTPWWFGYSRGWYEGNDTLVVETTNFLGNTTGVGGNGGGTGTSEALRLTERFTRVAPDVLNYEATIDDPRTYTRPWKLLLPLTANPGYQVLPYECHEGNLAIANILSAARSEDRAAEEAVKKGLKPPPSSVWAGGFAAGAAPAADAEGPPER